MLLPIALITGPAIPDIIISLIAIYFLFKSIFKKLWSYYQNPIVIGFLLFCLYGLLRSIFFEMPIFSLTNEGSAFYFRYIFFSMGIWYLIDENPYLSKCFIVVSILCLFIISIDGLYQYFNSINIFGNEKSNLYRLTGLFGKEQVIGRYISYLSMFTFALIYENYNKSKKILLLNCIFLFFFVVVIFLSGERSPFFNICLFVFFITIFIKKLRVYFSLLIIFIVIIIYSLLQINPIAKERMLEQTITQVSETKLSILPYSRHHEEHYISALKMFIDNPVFGKGTNTFRFHCKKDEYKITERSCSTHPHNFFIQVLAELGILGMLFLLTFFSYLIFCNMKFLINQIRNSSDFPPKFFFYPIILFIYWWPLIPHMSLYNNWNNVFIMLPLGYLMKYLFITKKYGNFFSH